MALTFEVETGTGSTTGNSYASVSDGDDYHKSRIRSESWQDTTPATRESALIWATRLLDSEVDWHGSSSNVDQALAWPRVGVRHRNGHKLIDNDEIPTWLKEATSELARYLLEEDRTAEDDTKGFKRIKAGELDIEVDKYDRKKILPRSVISMVREYGIIAGSGVIRLVRA